MTEYNYDDGQFYPIFILVLAAILTLPATYSAIKPSKDLENTAPKIRSDYKPENADVVEGLKKKQKRKERKVKRMLFSAFGWSVMTWMVWLIAVTARTSPQVWDPYSVLGVSKSASENEIKKHYRELALTDHPDKAKLDPSKNQTMDDINEHWVEITKAFKALTDDEVRNNYLQYGNPDGKQGFSMGIALPKFIVSEGNGKYTLAFYLGLIGIFLPWLVGTWWYGTQKVTKDGVLVKSAGSLFKGYREDGKPGEIIAMLSSGDEFSIILPGPKADTGLAAIETRILTRTESSSFACGMSTKDKERLVDMDEGVRRKALALLWAYLGRVDLSDATLNAEKLEVAPIAYTLNDALIAMSLAFGNMTPLLSSYKVSQSLIQAISPDLPPLLQLPYFNPHVVRAVEGETPRTHMTVQDFMALPAESRRKRACGPNLLTEAQLRSAESIASQLPYLKVERTFFKVHGERCVTPSSLVQFVVKTRMIPPGTTEIPPASDQALEEPDKPPKQQSDEEQNRKRIAPPLAHSPFFARDHSPRWHLFLADGKQGKVVVPPTTFTTFGKPLFTEDGKPTFNVQTQTLTFGAPPQPGTYTFLMHLVCDSYLGLDTMMNVKMVVEDASKAEAIEDEGEISEPEEDSLAGQMQALRRGKKVSEDDESDGSNTEGEDGDDDTSETDTDTDSDEE